MKRLIILTTLLLSIVALKAQTGEITGIIKDAETGEPAEFVNVYIEQNGNSLGTMTDEHGRYTIKPIPEGVYTVIAGSMEYETRHIDNVLVNPDGIRNLDFDLGENVIIIDGGTVYRTLIDLDEAGVPDHIYSGDLEKMPVTTLVDAVSIKKGIYQADAGDTPIFRGARVENTIYMFEGMRMRGDTYISKAAVGSIKVINGGMPAKYGDCTGGIIVINMRGFPML